jgi:hypothetical protein
MIYWSAALACALLSPAGTLACSMGGPPVSDERYDEINRQVLVTLNQLFEGEIIQDGPEEWALRVGKVYRGQLVEGMILRGQPLYNSCDNRQVKKGDRGIIWVGWGPFGPSFTNNFLRVETAASLRRIGALPRE